MVVLVVAVSVVVTLPSLFVVSLISCETVLLSVPDELLDPEDELLLEELESDGIIAEPISAPTPPTMAARPAYQAKTAAASIAPR